VLKLFPKVVKHDEKWPSENHTSLGSLTELNTGDGH